MGTIDILFSIAALLISASYLFRDILFLRLVTLGGCLVYALAGFINGYTAPGMKALIFFSLVNFFINFYQIIILIIERIPIVLPNEIKDIYKSCFSMMTPTQFMKLYKLAKTHEAHKGEKLAVQHEPIPNLLIIKDGIAKVIKDRHTISSLEGGFFVGEMSFLSEGTANATVEVSSDKLTYIVWNKKKLSVLQNKNVELYNLLKKAISINLIKKIDIHSEQQKRQAL